MPDGERFPGAGGLWRRRSANERRWPRRGSRWLPRLDPQAARSRFLIIVAAVVIGLLRGLATAPAEANMAAPWQPGDPLGEPSGALQSVAIELETLNFDLRPLASGDPAIVDATYHLRNDGPARTLDLVFVAAALTEGHSGAAGTGHQVWLDDTAVPSAATTLAVAPASWQPPKTTPPIPGDPGDGGDASGLHYRLRGDRALTFSIALPPGRHTVHVHYGATPSLLSGDVPTKYWQLGYVLAPARQWASFGRLDVGVQLPPAWLAASSLPLTRRGDQLTGTFGTLPAGTLALTVRAPAPRAVRLPAPTWLAAALALAAAAFAGRRLDRRRGKGGWALGVPALVLLLEVALVVTAAIALAARTPVPLVLDLNPFAWIGGLFAALALGTLAGTGLGRRRRSALWAAPLAVLVGVAWMIIVPLAATFSLLTPRVSDTQVAWDYDYGAGEVSVFLAFFALLAGIVVTQVTALIVRHRSLRQAPLRQPKGTVAS